MIPWAPWLALALLLEAATDTGAHVVIVGVLLVMLAAQLRR